jgi:dipeptidyl aminopeptidase/acylaminoacyl peptidase
VYSSGGLRVSGYIIRPPRLDEPRPTIIHARGGNRELGAIGPLTLLDFLSLAEAGYIVIGSQYRGGPGAEGRDEFGGDDLQDLLSLVPLAHARAEVDARNLFLWAVSRGGMMAALALRTGMRVRAAAMRAPIVDLAEIAALRPDMRDLFEELMPDYAAAPERALARRSAIHWTHQLRVPMFIQHAREDRRVPVSQSQRLAKALRNDWPRGRTNHLRPRLAPAPTAPPAISRRGRCLVRPPPERLAVKRPTAYGASSVGSTSESE